MKKFIALMIVVCSVSGYSQNFNDALRISEQGLGSSARSLGVGNSNIAIGGNVDNFYLNPAGLGLLSSNQLSIGMDYNTYSDDALFYNHTTNYNSNSANFNNLVYGYKFPTTRGSMVFAFGYNRNKDYNRMFKFAGFNNSGNSLIQDITRNNDNMVYRLGLSYPVFDPNTNQYLYDDTKIQGQLTESGLLAQDGRTDNWSFGGALEVAKDIFVGANITYISGKFNSDRELNEIDSRNIYGDNFRLDDSDYKTAGFENFYFNDVVKWKYHGWDFKLGVIADLIGFIKLGATIKLPVNYTIEEAYTINAESQFTSGFHFVERPSYTDKIKYNISSPFEFSAGAAVNLFFVKLSGSFEIIDYPEMEFKSGLPADIISENNKVIKDIFQTSYNLNFGAEFWIPVFEIKARTGFMYKASPYKGDPKEFDKKYLTFGLGLFNRGGISIDAAYAHGAWEEYTDNYGNGESRVQHKVNTDYFMLTATMDLY